MKAIIVAAGRGSRLYPLTKDTPKPLLNIGDQTILKHQIQNLKRCGIKDIVIVTGYRAEKIKKAGGPDIKYLYNPSYENTNSLVSLWLAKDYLTSDFIYLQADVVFHRRILEQLLDLQAKAPIYLVVDRKECVEEDMKARVKDDFVLQLSKTMPSAEAYGEFIGIAKFSQEILGAFVQTLDEIVKEGHLMAWFEDAVQRLINTGVQAYKLDIHGLPWIEIDFPEDLELARNKIYPAITKEVR